MKPKSDETHDITSVKNKRLGKSEIKIGEKKVYNLYNLQEGILTMLSEKGHNIFRV